jgi:multidrug efflux pump subunit AcrA (membrane-fusion protein)
LKRTKITAPVDCVIVTDDCEEGSYVQAGKVVAVVNDLHRAEVSCQLELDDLFWLWKIRSPQELAATGSQPGIVYDIPAVPVVVEFLFHDRLCRWSGVISRLGGTGIDLTTRTIPCRILVDNPLRSVVLNSAGETVNDILPPPLTTGMFVNVKIAVEPKEDLLSVPPTAARSGGVVWIMREGKLKIQPIKVARRLKDQVLINVTAGGVQADDRVVVSPLAVAMDGMLIEEKRRE